MKKTRAIHLDGMFMPVAFPIIKYNQLKFPGGELHIKLNNNIDYSDIDKVIITHRVNSSDDLMLILLAKDALERKGVKNFDLIIPYIPYARQDRVCVNGEPLSIKVFSNILNSAKFDNIHVLDSHSDVATALIDNCINHNNHKYVEKALNGLFMDDIILISPDAGAVKKTYNLASDLNVDSIVKCDKERDVYTGNLLSFNIYEDEFNNKDCIIVDDICDGGGTFIGLAKELRKKNNVGNIYLFVTHGIFSKGFDELNKYFAKIYTTNSIKEIDNNNVKQFKIQL